MGRMLITAALLLAIGGTASAQLTADTIKRSQWNTSYEAIGGGKVSATVTFDGDSGTYETSAGTGTLSGVKYDVRLGGGATITGRWRLGGTDGKFTFFVAGNSNPPAFSGSWQANGRSGNWNGRFVGVAQPPVGGGPAGAGGGGGGGGQVTYDKDWSFNQAKGYYYKKCSFPAGGYQYLVYYKSKPNWVYWYNPGTQVFWCACPTVNHPKWGDDIKNGKDLFLMADKKAKNIEDAEFPSAGDDGANFKKGTAKDKDGSEVDLTCPPPDLP